MPSAPDPNNLPPLLPQDFCAGDALDVAGALLGKTLARDGVALRISEVEAYRWPDDSANHCHRGRTPRNQPMWGPAGHAYVYLCYGIHHLLNIVTNREGEGAVVLIRSCQPLFGEEIIRRRRGGKGGPVSLTGPGKVGQALALDTSWCNHALFTPGGLELRDGEAPQRILRGPRVGIDYAEPRHRDAPWRLAEADSPWVTHRKALA